MATSQESNGADEMRHSRKDLTSTALLRWPGTHRSQLLVEIALASSPVLTIVVSTLFGLHVAAGVLAQIWLLPVLIGVTRWGPAGGAVASFAALATLYPRFTPLILGQGDRLTAVQWGTEAGLYVALAACVVLLINSRLATRGRRGSLAASSTYLELSDRVLTSLANTVEIRDHHTQGHCKRVARNALVMGRALNLSSEDLTVLHWAATLHDLGKIAVPEYILLKSGRLSEEEYAEIRRHPMYGADLLASVSTAYRPIADVVRAHHERWDGLGYPLGAKGEEIPELARIIAIVDVFEALTSERPYRSPMPGRQALSYIRNGSGTQFDPRLVQVFEGLFVAGDVECAAASVFSTGAHGGVPEPILLRNA